MNDSTLLDAQVRIAAFRWLREQVDRRGDEALPAAELRRGFKYGDRLVPLMSQQGIFKPAILPSLPLSIMTSINSPYDDHVASGDLLGYRYRGTDPWHRDNVGLRNAMARRTPLIYFCAEAKGLYLAIWPVFIVGDDPAKLTFYVAADEAGLAERAVRQSSGDPISSRDAADEGRRAYITRAIKARLHQRSFRERVLRAYRDQCALCRLRHRDLLDAAHIVPDTEARGEPLVVNGLSLCKIHHAAFDHLLIGIRPDYTVQVHPKVLEESDGPMLQHGLQRIHDSRLILPRARKDHPDPERLAQRYERFLGAA